MSRVPVRLELRREHSRLSPTSGPWIRRRWIRDRMGPPDPAALACVTDNRGATVAWGLYAPESEIELRVLSYGEAPPPATWLEDRIAGALRARERLGLGLTSGDADGPQTTGVRMINTEGDGLPGLVADRYGDDWVLQITTAAMAARQAAIIDCLSGHIRGRLFVLHPPAIAAREGFAAAPILPDVGDGEPPPLEFLEHGLRFRVPAPPSQKTGAYFDQRDNRRLIAELAARRGGALLDLGCHVGGFAIHAAAAGVEAVGLDQSAAMLELAAANAERCGVASRTTWVRGDLFGPLDAPALDRRFATIVVDPPKIASSRRDLGRAIKAQRACLRRVAARLEDDGLLVVCSCSHHLGREHLDESLPRERGAQWRRLYALGPGPDHPVLAGHVEGEYLRVNVYQRC
jgi:23S rRNA (cytosine1962-C5)-methyltransferase